MRKTFQVSRREKGTCYFFFQTEASVIRTFSLGLGFLVPIHGSPGPMEEKYMEAPHPVGLSAWLWGAGVTEC